jgi:thioesterase domain-containing protein
MSYQRIIREYVVNQYPGRITLIVNETFHSIDRHRGWRDIPVGELAVKKVPGDHITMFTEHGEVLAQLLLESVDSTLSQSGWCADGIEVGAS